MKWARWGAALALGAMASMTSVIALANHVEGGHLVAVGPASPLHGYPVWYRDARGLSLELCYDHLNPLCNIPAAEVPNPAQPVSFPDNFAGETFWWMGDAAMTTSGGDALLIMALEAAWNQEVVIPGDQISFGRIRLRVDLNTPGTYTITHPYGVDTFEVTATGRRAINSSEDIGIQRGVFTGAMESRIGPFLVWNEELPAPPPGYIGDPGTPHPVTGSPFGEAQNVFRIEGPGVGTPGSPFLCTPGNLNCVETRLFTIMGKIATISGVGADRVSYARDAGGAVSLSTFASSTPDQVILLEGAGVVSEGPLQGEEGRYFGFADVTGLPPSSVTISNESDEPPTVIEAAVTDVVTIVRAEYDPVRFELLVEAASSDQLPPGPALEAVGYGPLPSGVALFTGVVAPPASITVTSSAGGSDTEPVAVSGGPVTPIPVVANAGVDQIVQSGATVFLDGSATTGNIVGATWLQTAGAAVVISGNTTLTPSFVAPFVPGVLTFELRVNGFGGPSIDTVQVEVVSGPPPVANAGADQFVQAGVTVTLNGSASVNATSYAWQQISGSPIVALTGANTATPTFTFPADATALVFELTASGNGASATDSVIVSPVLSQPAPVANAGADRTVAPGITVLLDGSGSSNVTAFAWSQLAGPAVTLTGANTVNPSFVYPAGATSLSFLLTVTGLDGTTTATDAVIITAETTTPAAPVAAAGADRTVVVGSTVVLDGSGSSNATAFAWSQIAGPAVTLTGANTASPSFVYPAGATSLGFMLTVTGLDGTTTATDTVVITGEAAPIPAPIANAGPDQTVAIDSVVVLDGSATRNAVSLLWEQVSGTPVALSGVTTPSPTFVFPAGGTALVFRLTATGADGATHADTVAIEPLVPVVDVLTVTRAEFRTDDGRWNVRGTSTIPSPNEVRVYLSNGSTLVGVATWSTATEWRLDVRGSGVIPQPNERLVIRSTAGGQLTGVTLQQRR